MELTLLRNKPSAKYVAGALFVDAEPFCFTLEDPPRAELLPGITGIPAGRYQVMVTYSPKFKKPLPLVMGVPGRTGIRIHSGRTAHDTEGCILVGYSWSAGRLSGAEASFHLKALLEKSKAPVFINIKDFK